MRIEEGFEWWALPGPRAFVLEVADALEDGASVVLALPDGAPTGLLDHIIAVLDVRASLHWRTIDLSEPGKIAQMLASALIPMKRLPARAFATDIVLDPALRSSVIHVTGIDQPDRFRDFKAFLHDFNGCIRRTAAPRSQTPRLIFSLPQSALCNPRIDIDPGLIRVMEWRRRVLPCDMQLYVATRMLNRRDIGPTNVIQRIVVELSGWDPRFADIASRWSDSEILRPIEKLKELARGWEVRPLAWHEGTLDSVGDRDLPHLMHFLCGRRFEEIDRRIWRAHSAEIFPWLEELRVELIDDFRAQIRMPHVSQNNDVIEDPDLLEIGQLYWNLKHLARLPESQLRLVDLCRRSRNDLAHRRPVEVSRLRTLESEWLRHRARKRA